MKVLLATLGCPKNAVDSECMAALMEEAGHELVDAPARADLIIVNTCGFIEAARQESIDALRELSQGKRRNQILVAAGCLAQRWGERLVETVPAIDGLIGTRRWNEITGLIDGLGRRRCLDASRLMLLGDPPLPGSEHEVMRPLQGASAYLKIADGCSAPCAFCAIPAIKGPAHSRPVTHIVGEARALVDAGAREIILIAQDTTAYGRDLGVDDGLPDLIEQILLATPDLDWLRIMYAYPQQISSRLIDVMAQQPQVCHYLDLPLQHGHPDVLRRMRRPYDVDRVLGQITQLRQAMPDIALRTSLIVGYPGETEAEFETLLEFVEEFAFDRVGVFVYSAEEGTPAAELPGQVPDDVKQARYEQVMARQQAISLAGNQAVIGRTLDALVEGAGDGISVARTYRDAPEIDGLLIIEGEVDPGEMGPVTITAASEYDLWGAWA
jgi:ribosomal protein S12 methylthiotransferase